MQIPVLGSMSQYIAFHARHSADAPAIVEGDLFVSYRTFAADLVRCARAIEALGVRPDMIVGIENPRRYMHLLLLLACEAIGAATASLPPDLNDDIIRHCGIILASRAPAAEDLPRTEVIPSEWPAALAATVVSDEELTLLDREISPDSVARIVRTSGTTGKQKAMCVTLGNELLRARRCIDRVEQDILPNPRFLCLYSLAVSNVYWRALGVLQFGGTLLFTLGRHAGPLIASGAVNYAMFAVGDAERFVEVATPSPAGHVLRVEMFGAALTPRLRGLVRERLNARVANLYSTNETSPIAIVGDDGIGTLCPGVEARVVDSSGRNVPLGETGMIRVRSETMVQGYFDNPAITAAAFIDGWYVTNDIGFTPEPGKVVVLGRADDMLNIGGVKVPPAPIEEQVRLIEGVRDVIVLSVASANEVGNLVTAIEIDSDPLPEELTRRIGAIISKYVGKFEIMPLASFPRTESGKIKRPEIEAAFRQRQVL